jgi:hypothetical protein
MDIAMALLLGPVLYGHVFHKEAHIEKRDFGREAAEAFSRAYTVDAAPRPGTDPGKAKRTRSTRHSKATLRT